MQYDIHQKVLDILKLRKDIIPDYSTKCLIRFTTKKIDEYVPKIGREWTRSSRLVLFEIQNFEDSVSLNLIIGPGAEDARIKLIEHIKKNNPAVLKVFNKYGKKWTTVYQVSLLEKSDYQNPDTEQMVETIRKKLNQFYDKDLKEIENLLGNFSSIDELQFRLEKK